jgi:DTW domain-containing protein YfiP
MAKEKKPNPFAKGKAEKKCAHCDKAMSKCKCKAYKK